MKIFLILFLYLGEVYAYKVDNPNNYLDFSIDYIKEDLNKRIGATHYDVLVLRVHVNVNAQYVETSLDSEIERLLLKKEGRKCRQLLTEFKKKTLSDCRMEKDFQLLALTRGKFATLNEVACLTSELCELLNPLKTQAAGLEKCELSKIADLRHQSFLVSEEFGILKQKLFEDHDKCIRSLLSTVYSDLAKIAYGDDCQKT